jgi:hypothetical protein
MILARPARRLDGSILFQPGQHLDSTTLHRLDELGVQELWVVKAGEPVPDATVPEYLDRYGPDFAAHIQQVFADAMVNRTMQQIFLTALGHATDCYRRYRLEDEA